MAHVGAIGAKTQYGFGQFDWENKIGLKESLITIQEFLDSNNFKEDMNNPNWYSFNKFWFYELNPKEGIKKFKNNNFNFIGSEQANELILPVSFDIRYKFSGNINGLREYYYQKHGKKETSIIFGTNTPEKIGSKVFVSHIFRKKVDDDYKLRVWGFTEVSVSKEVCEELKKLFKLEKSPVIGEELCKEVKNDI